MRLLLLLAFPLFATGQTDSLVVHFDYDKSTIRASDSKKIEAFRANLGTEDSLTVTGHADSDGDAEYNRRLGRLRAIVVAKRFPGYHTRIQSKGEQQPLGASHDLDRRVVIIRHRVIDEVVESPPQVEEPKEESQSLKETKLEVGKKIVLKNLQFVGGRHVLLGESLPYLKELLQLMKDNPTLKIKIQGHVCCTPAGMDGYDQDMGTPNLSTNRARVIHDWLLREGISPERLDYIGLGGSYPLVEEVDDASRAINRRVEFLVVDL